MDPLHELGRPPGLCQGQTPFLMGIFKSCKVKHFVNLVYSVQYKSICINYQSHKVNRYITEGNRDGPEHSVKNTLPLGFGCQLQRQEMQEEIRFHHGKTLTNALF